VLPSAAIVCFPKLESSSPRPKCPTSLWSGLVCPLVNGLMKSDTDSLLEFFEGTEDILHQTLWDVPLVDGKTALLFPASTLIETKDLPKSTTLTTLISSCRARAPRLLETTTGS
jgi:hypothetical protein